MIKYTNSRPICTSLNGLDTILFILFLFPTCWGYLSIGQGQLFFLISTFVLVSVSLVRYRGQIKFPRAALMIFGTLLLYYLFSLNVNASFLGNKTISFRDYSDVLRPLFYLFYFSVPCFLGFTASSLKSFVKSFIVLSLGILLFDAIKFMPRFEPYLKLYTLFEPGTLNYIRFSGTFCFCYNYGFIILFNFALCLYGKFRYRYFVAMAYVLLLLSVGSRSVMIACVVLVLGYYYFSSRAVWKKIAIIPMLFGGGVLLYLLVQWVEIPIISDSVEYAERLIQALSGEAQDGSFNTRSAQLDRVLTLFNQSPIVGNGPLKEEIIPIEIQMGYYLSAWGLFGLLLFLGMMAAFFVWAHRTSRSSDPMVSTFSKANRLWILSSFFVGMSTPITDQMRVFQIFYLVQGVQYVLYRRHLTDRRAKAIKMLD